MSLSRSHKLGWIAFVSAIVGFLIAQALGATTATHYSIMIAIPVLIGLAIGFLAFDAESEIRNVRGVALAIGVVILCVAITVGFAVYVIYSSTDL